MFPALPGARQSRRKRRKHSQSIECIPCREPLVFTRPLFLPGRLPLIGFAGFGIAAFQRTGEPARRNRARSRADADFSPREAPAE